MARNNSEAVRRMLERLHERGAFPERPTIRRFEVQADNDYSGDPAYSIPEDRWPYVRTIRESEQYLTVDE